MKRPSGVTAAAVVVIVGSVLALVMGVALFAASYGPAPTGPNAPQIANYPRVMRDGAFLAVAFAVLGLSTGAGLLKMRAWARVSLLVFAGVTAVVCLGAAASIAVMPMPAGAAGASGLGGMLRPLLILVYGVPFAISVWWLIGFNRPSTRDAFEGKVDPAAVAAPMRFAGRPMSMTVIGWWLMVGGAMSVMPALSGLPVLLFGTLVSGWTATVVYVVFAALQISAGTGVLRLQEPARVLAMAWFAFGILNLLVIVWRPDVGPTLMQWEHTMGTLPAGQPPFDMIGFMRRLTPLWMLVGAIPIWFLARRRQAFHATHDA